MAAATPPELIDDAVREILLRLPPDEPEHLCRAGLVCKPWLRIIRDPAFLRCYRAFHRTPPLLGLFHRFTVRPTTEGEPVSRLVPATAAPLPPFPYRIRSRALDSRHGRVLLHLGDAGWRLVVWDPVTGDEHRLPRGPIPWMVHSAAVLCDKAGCDHVDCHGGPFRVVLMVTEHDAARRVKVIVYSSGTGAWSTPDDDDSESSERRRDAIAKAGYFTTYIQTNPGVVTGDGFYYFTIAAKHVFKYDWANNCFSMIGPPSPDVQDRKFALTVTEDSLLGYAYIQDSSLYLWTRKVNSEGAEEWVQYRVIKLETIIPVANFDDEPSVVGFAEGVGVIFISTVVGLFSIQLKSKRVRKVDEPGDYFSVLPYMSFYSPEN